MDIARAVNVYERLMDYDGESHVVPKLALSIEPNKTATQWVIKLRKGVTFHDGSPLTPEDVIYSLHRIMTGKGTEGRPGLSMVDPRGLKKLDASSVLVKLLFPYSDLVSQLALRPMAIIKAGTTTFTTLNGTGPFKFQSAVPGQLEKYVANPNYWVSGHPYVDAVELHDIEDSTARLNAADRESDRRDEHHRCVADPGRQEQFLAHADGVAVGRIQRAVHEHAGEAVQ